MYLSEAKVGAFKSATNAQPLFPPRVRVLIVDDLPDNRLMLGLCCDQCAVLHESVEDGLAAVEAARSGRFDLILMDTFMVRMDGISATYAIRALPGPVSAIPIIAVTPTALPGDVARYLACGMTDVVAKPVNLGRLAEAMSAALARSPRDWRQGPHEVPAPAAHG